MTAQYVFAAPARPSLPVVDTNLSFPINRVWCAAKNYPAHAREMGSDPTREPPRFFAKPPDAATFTTEVPYPPATEDLQHEVELVLALCKGGRNIAASDALGHIFGCAVGVDLTRRDLQRQAKSKGQPWDLAKGFDKAAPCSIVVLGPPPNNAELWLKVNGEERQRGNVGDMTWSPAELIAKLSSLITLQPGDLIFTGTPAGVSTIGIGDQIEAAVDGLATVRFTITAQVDTSPSAA
ncbi:MAG: hypothetical protein A2289_17100 [Deltaproteobacteria bacterium RIFOXYA12_FULL_58_15]|nr:MAG: hypothetical protein A2289_17100 [Deltaproteobacteria bacterium RIFOXYA12_FULL_58_15]